MVERLPEVQRLTDAQKFQLATELWDQLAASESIDPDPAIVRLLEQRYTSFKAGNQPSTPWSEIKSRIGK
jgi:putative addiction module component (TIGR02574 family)